MCTISLLYHTPVTTTLDQVRQEIAKAVKDGRRPPGRPTLARMIGVSQHQVREALAQLADQQASVDTTTRQDPPPVAASPVEVVAELPAVVEPEPATGASPASLAPAGDSEPPIRRGWLVLLALPAFVAVWGGWVGLGGYSGFGPVDLLPGMPISWTVNLAITLPAGMEVYAVIGLRVWLSARTRSQRTRRFAMFSTLAALAIGCSGQVAYHVLARPPHSAPMFVVVCVACLPVAVLGMGAALFHLVGEDSRTTRKD